MLFRSGFFPGDRILGAAIAAVDIALWDIKGLPRARARAAVLRGGPAAREAPEAYAALRARTAVPLAVGEQYASKWEFPRAARPRPDRLLPRRPLHRRRVHGAAQLAGWCEAHHVLMATHNPLGPVATAAALEFNLACPNFGICELAVVPDRASPFFAHVPEVAGGALVPGGRPGLGVELDREAARASRPGPHELPLLRREDGAFTSW